MIKYENLYNMDLDTSEYVFGYVVITRDSESECAPPFFFFFCPQSWANCRLYNILEFYPDYYTGTWNFDYHFILFIYLFIFIYLFMIVTERERERGRDTGRGRGRLHAPVSYTHLRAHETRV